MQDRWRRFSIDEVKEHHYKLDAFKWLRDEDLDDLDELPEPEELITEAMEELQLALDGLGDIQRLLEGNGASGE
jgi:type I restriction enzyme M protein